MVTGKLAYLLQSNTLCTLRCMKFIILSTPHQRVACGTGIFNAYWKQPTPQFLILTGDEQD